MVNSVEVSRQGTVTVVTLSRPQVRNAVDFETAEQLYEAFLAFDADEQARVAVLHGANGHFCAGWDLAFGVRWGRRASAYAQGDLDLPHALHQEWQGGKACIAMKPELIGHFGHQLGRGGEVPFFR